MWLLFRRGCNPPRGDEGLKVGRRDPNRVQDPDMGQRPFSAQAIHGRRPSGGNSARGGGQEGGEFTYSSYIGA